MYQNFINVVSATYIDNSDDEEDDYYDQQPGANGDEEPPSNQAQAASSSISHSSGITSIHCTESDDLPYDLTITDLYEIMHNRYEKGLEKPSSEIVAKFASKQEQAFAEYSNVVD